MQSILISLYLGRAKILINIGFLSIHVKMSGGTTKIMDMENIASRLIEGKIKEKINVITHANLI